MNFAFQFLESHEMELIHVIGRLEMREQSNSDHENCFFQYLYRDTGRIFSSNLLPYFFIFYILKKILEGESFPTYPSSLNYPQLGVDYNN